ncbi:MAG TPA: hypothetical protein VFF52_18385 [Isosphaeraceae bacterium]|nr:hypothetical protein [Isosphaeraceae bacterium]
MAVGFADQVVAYLANPANQGPFLSTVGLAAFAGTSFTQRYGQGGFQVDGVTLGTAAGFQLQRFLFDTLKVAGYREKRSEQPQRHWYELRVGREDSGWVDVAFTVPAQFALHAFPGSIPLGPGGDLVTAGVSDPAPLQHQLAFLLPVGTDAFTLSYTLGVYVFASSDPSPVADLRRVQGLRRLLENDPQFLAALDGSGDQRPYVFVQLYAAGALQGGPLSEAAVVQMFAAADVLAAFLTLPAM